MIRDGVEDPTDRLEVVAGGEVDQMGSDAHHVRRRRPLQEVLATLTEKGQDLLERAAPSHVTGVRAHLVDLADSDDFEALGRVFDAVADHLVSAHPEMEIRT